MVAQDIPIDIVVFGNTSNQWQRGITVDTAKILNSNSKLLSMANKSSSFQCQLPSNARSLSRLAMSSTINSDLQSISEWGTHNLVKFNTFKTQLLTISLSNTPSNYPIIFEDNEIPPLNSTF